jgi:dipeptide/tripeptide permease
MILMALGTGLIRPNITVMLGGLYPANDPRRDSGFSMFYMSLNIGALLAPVICGFFAQWEISRLCRFSRFSRLGQLALGLWRCGSWDDLWASSPFVE